VAGPGNRDSDRDEQVRRLEAAIAAQEALRPTVGDEAADAAVAALRTRLTALREPRAAPSPPRGEVRPPGRYTALFADLAGFTALSEARDPDEVREFLDDLMLEISDAIEAYGGLVTQFLGDAAAAVFQGGDAAGPDAGDDAARALEAALLIVERGRALDAEWRERLGHAVHLHLGVEAGGRPGPASAGDDAVAVAARLQHRAGPGEILVGAAAQRLTGERFRFGGAPVGGEGAPLRGRRGAAPEIGRPRAGERAPAAGGDAEIRQATVVFADLADPARACAALSPPELEAFRQDLMHVLAEAGGRFGGSVERIFGDAVLVLFGAPVAHEDDPERAIRSAALMQELAEGLERRWQSRLGGPIALRIGVNTGTVVAGGLALGGEATYAVTGDTLNTAARLRGAAAPGEILIGPDTARLVGHAALLEPLTPLVLKGKARPVQAHRLRELRAPAAAVRGLRERGIAAELVGRETETGALGAALDRLRARQGGVLAVVGDPGLGKSRLMAETRSREAAGLLWLEGRTLSYTSELSYWPFLQVVRQAAGIREGDDESTAWARLERRLRGLFGGEVAEPLVYLATMLGLEITGELAERVRYLDADALRRQVFRAARRFFEALAREQPLVLLIEDLHWADASSAALLEHLLPLTAELPLLLCWATRPDLGPGARLAELARADYAGRFTDVRLQPLAREDGDRLLRRLLGDALPPAVRRAILDKAEGNPFFVEEVIRGMIDCGAVAQDRGGAWHVGPEAEGMAIPDTVQGVIMARIDRLDEDLKRVLRLASVIGRSFFMRVLRSIAAGEEALDENVSALSTLELLRRKEITPELEYMFRHALVQETAYESIVRRRRRELHRRVGAAIETLFADRLEEFHGLLAYHAARGEDWDRAQRYLLAAGDQAARLAADEEALAHYRRAVDACERALGDRWQPRERAALDRRIGEALFRRGRFSEAVDFLTAALDRHGRRYPRTAGAVRRAIVRQLARQFGHRQLPRLALRGRRDDPIARECSQIYHSLSWIHYHVDQQRLVLDALCGLNEAERAGDSLGTCRGLMAVGLLFGAAGLHGLSGRYHREAVQLGEAQRQPVALGQAYLGLGIHLFDTGDWDGCARVMEQSGARYLEAGDLRGWGASAAWLFWIAVYRGDFVRGLDIAGEMARYGDEAADGQLSRFGLHYRGAALSRAGELAEAVTLLERAVGLYAAVPEVIGMAHASGDLGLCHARLGDLPRAIEVLEEANRALDEHGLNAGGSVPPRAALAEVYALAAAEAEGPERAARLRQAERAAAACLRLGRLHHESRIFGHRVAGTCAWLAGNPDRAHAEWDRALTLAERLGARYEVDRLRREIATRTAPAGA